MAATRARESARHVNGPKTVERNRQAPVEDRQATEQAVACHGSAVMSGQEDERVQQGIALFRFDPLDPGRNRGPLADIVQACTLGGRSRLCSTKQQAGMP